MITADGLQLVEAALMQAVRSDVGLLAKASEHIVRSGGKRIRPRVVLLSYKAAGGQDISQAVPLAAAVELLHTASLVHDDINDHSSIRRGRETVNARWGSDVALLVGDFVFVRLLNLVASLDSRVIQVLADCCTAIVEGETRQVLRQGDAEMSEDTYLSIVSQKTAELFAACGELGALTAGGTQQEIRALRGYGINLGVAFQIRDDTLDLVGDGEKLGKPVTADLEQGKMSLATLFALKELRRAGQRVSAEDVRRTPGVLQDTGALEYAMETASLFAEKARKALAHLPESAARSELDRLAGYAIIRDQ